MEEAIRWDDIKERYTLATDPEKLGRAADYVETVIDQTGSGCIALYFESRSGQPAPYDVCFVNPNGLYRISRRYRIREGGTIWT